MTVFLTPDARAVLRRHLLPAGGPPRHARLPAGAWRGRRGLARPPRRRREQAEQLGARTSASSSRSARPAGEVGADAARRARVGAAAARASTRSHGGFGGAPKFPAPMTARVPAARVAPQPATPRAAGDGRPARSTAWRAAASTTSSAAASTATHRRRAGWCRTSRRCSTTTRCWRTPTSRRIRSRAASATPTVARETARLRAARDARPTTAASPRPRDADSEGEEGRFYVWTAAEFAALLGAGGATAPTRSWPLLGRHRRRQLRGPQHPERGGRREAAARRELLEPARPRRCSPRASGACARRATTSCSPPGTGMALRALAPWLLVARRASVTARPRAAGQLRADHLLRDDGPPLAHRARRARAHAWLRRGLRQRWPTACWPPMPRSGEPEDLRAGRAPDGPAVADFWDEASGTLFDTGRRARPHRGAAALARRRRDAIGQRGGGRRAAAAGAAHRRAGLRPPRAQHPARRGSRPRPPADRLRPDAQRGDRASRPRSTL